MAGSENCYHELKIACAILDTSIAQLARDWGCSDTAITFTAQRPKTSKRLRKKIESTIEKAQEVVPFSYPTNEQLNEQHSNNAKVQLDNV